MNRRTGTARPAVTFEDVVVPHLDAAYRLARWLVANGHDAEDVVQEACLRGLRYFPTYSGGSGRAWLLRIVRNTCHDWHSHTRQLAADVFDEEQHAGDTLPIDPETLMLHAADVGAVEQAIGELPARFRELLVLRELEGRSYRDLADMLGIPIGTVMSRLARARQALRRALDTRPSPPMAQPPGISKPTGRPSRTMSSGSVAERIRNRTRGAFFRRKAT